MRSLAFAGILAVLAGCSMPYQGKSFSAVPKPHHMAEGESHEINAHGPEEEESKSQGDTLSATEAAHSSSDAGQDQSEATTSRAAAVFPSTAKPTGKDPHMVAAPSEAGPTSEPVHAH